VPQLLVNSGQVTSAISFSALFTLFEEYRVVGMEVEVFPLVNAQTSLATPAPSMLAIGKMSSGTSPATYQEIAQAPESKIVNGLRPFKFVCSAKGFVDGLLVLRVAMLFPYRTRTEWLLPTPVLPRLPLSAQFTSVGRVNFCLSGGALSERAMRLHPGRF
jgi:hypothetical protein